MPKRLRTRIYNQLIKPIAAHPDQQRREYIFNVLICLFTVAALLALVSSVLNHVAGNSPENINSIPVTMGFLIITGSLWWLSRKGRYDFGAYVLSGLVWIVSLQLVLAWSFELPMAQLINVLVIAVAGVVLSSTAALLFTLLVVATTLIVGYLQTQGMVSANTQWLSQPLEFSDAIGQAVIYIIIGGILWLASKEIDNLLRRAWRSEAALAKERDELEITVARRTRELEQEQLARVLELQQFAEFGRVSANLLHDLANPVTAAALNLEEAGSHRRSKLVLQAMVSIGHIERYIKAARKQLQGGGELQVFDVESEITEVVELLRNQAAKAKVAIRFDHDSTHKIYGDLASFHRVVANMLINAIQSYEALSGTRQPVAIATTSKNDYLYISIQDQGVGIAPADLPHIFEDFYSTKKRAGSGLGLGLSHAKQVVEQDFSGSITVTSSRKTGTTFTLGIPLHELPNQRKYTTRTGVPGKSAKPKW